MNTDLLSKILIAIDVLILVIIPVIFLSYKKFLKKHEDESVDSNLKQIKMFSYGLILLGFLSMVIAGLGVFLRKY